MSQPQQQRQQQAQPQQQRSMDFELKAVCDALRCSQRTLTSVEDRCQRLGSHVENLDQQLTTALTASTSRYNEIEAQLNQIGEQLGRTRLLWVAHAPLQGPG